MKNIIPRIILILLTIGNATNCGRYTLQKSQQNCFQTIEVTNEAQFKTAVAKAHPGTIIEAADGDYSFNDNPLTIRLKATEELPIIVRAKNRGNAVFTGEYAVLLEECSYVTVEGFTFHNRALKHALPNAPSTETWLGAMADELPYPSSLVVLNSNHCRLTRLYIKLEEQKGFTPKMLEDRLPRMHWINLTGGQHNRVDHCWMEGKQNSGVYIEIGPLEQRFRIDHNHFAGRPPGNFNGFETIRANPGGLNDLYGKIDYNLFENCDGESEIISVKSSVLRISHNTFRDCQGMCVIRMGSKVTVDYNFFLNPSNKKDVGGVRNHGNDCNILNNYFGDLTGTGYQTCWGDYDKPDFTYEDAPFFKYNLAAKANSYPQTCRTFLAFNTWANCAAFLNLGKFRAHELADFNLPPKDWTIMNNIVICTDDQFIRGEGETGFRWMGNIFWNPNGKTNVGRDLTEAKVKVVDPQLVRSEDGLWRLSKHSPAIDNARGWYYPAQIVPEFSLGIDGQKRDMQVKVTTPQVMSEFRFDIGADEYSDAPITNCPLTSVDVGPDAP